jgi:2-dehydropantoate 2-reductase
MECRRVFDRAGIELDNIPGIPNLPKLTRLMRLMNAPVVGKVVTIGARSLFERQPIIFSAQQDIQRRKPTEVEYVNGEITRLAESAQTSAPLNAQVVELVHELEVRGDGTFFTRQEVIDRFERILSAAVAA